MTRGLPNLMFLSVIVIHEQLGGDELEGSLWQTELKKDLQSRKCWHLAQSRGLSFGSRPENIEARAVGRRSPTRRPVTAWATLGSAWLGFRAQAQALTSLFTKATDVFDFGCLLELLEMCTATDWQA
jgi:hypothetical protein